MKRSYVYCDPAQMTRFGAEALVLRSRIARRSRTRKEWIIALEPGEFSQRGQPVGGRFVHFSKVPLAEVARVTIGRAREKEAIAWAAAQGCRWNMGVELDQGCDHLFSFDDPTTAIEFKLLFG